MQPEGGCAHFSQVRQDMARRPVVEDEAGRLENRLFQDSPSPYKRLEGEDHRPGYTGRLEGTGGMFSSYSPVSDTVSLGCVR